MLPRVLGLLFAFVSWAAPSSPDVRSNNPYWFKTYPLSAFGETWTGEMKVADFPQDLPKVLKTIEKSGGALVQPIGNLAGSKKGEVQQLIFSISRGDAPKLMKDFRKIGDIPDPTVRGQVSPIPLDEVKTKIDLLMKERAERATELAKVPASAAASEEILEHLLLVEEIAKNAKDKILFNLTVKSK